MKIITRTIAIKNLKSISTKICENWLLEYNITTYETRKAKQGLERACFGTVGGTSKQMYQRRRMGLLMN